VTLLLAFLRRFERSDKTTMCAAQLVTFDRTQSAVSIAGLPAASLRRASDVITRDSIFFDRRPHVNKIKTTRQTAAFHRSRHIALNITAAWTSTRWSALLILSARLSFGAQHVSYTR
jgi:hypothetical protein